MDDESPTGLLATARAVFGIDAFRAGQEQVLRAVLAGKDVLAVMPTGAGKSLTYQLPSIVRGGLTVVVSPLIALMQDQAGKLDALGIPAVRLDSTVSEPQRARALREIARGKIRVAFVTPERLSDVAFRDALAKGKPILFAVDEAHCVSQWGHDFRPAYLGLAQAVHALGHPPVLALSATATPRVRADVLQKLGMRAPVIVSTGFDRPNLRLAVHKSSTEEGRRRRLVELLRAERGATVVYCATVQEVEALHERLVAEGLQVSKYHGQMRAREREAAQRGFMSRGDVPIIVATNAFGLGVDKADIRHVIHAQMPGSPEAYYQEAGRAGRDGLPARCTLLFRPEDRRVQAYFLGGRQVRTEDLDRLAAALAATPEGADASTLAETAGLPQKLARVACSLFVEDGLAIERPDGTIALADGPVAQGLLDALVLRCEARRAEDRLRLDAMLRYSTSQLCRVRMLLAWFGEGSGGEACGRCDVCARRAKGLSDVPAPPALRKPAPLPRSRVGSVNAGGLSRGARVVHPAFGEGEVLAVDDDRVTAFFPGTGERTVKRTFLTTAG